MTHDKLTEEQYLALDRAAEFRSEFVDGEIFAMSGGSLRHARLQRNLLFELQSALKDTGCEGFTSDMRVRVPATGMYAYPDVTVICGKPVLADEQQDILLNPVVIFEVLSPTTEKYDRGLKFQHYRAIESLKDYILVDQNQVLVEQFTRHDGNTWTLRDYQLLDQELTIPSINVSLPVRRIYDRIELPGA
jgi:Uma2 family endonuclease